MKYLIFTAALLLMILILIFPATAKESAQEAAEMWFDVLVPSLMPYSAAASILVKSGVLDRFSRPLNGITNKLTGFSGCFSYVFAASLLSGYPNGAQLCGELCEAGSITREEAASMINATSLCGPSFIICAVSSGMLRNISLSKYILLAHISASAIVALFHGKRAHTSQTPPPALMTEQKSAWEIITSSISGAASAMLNILGFTVVLSVASGIIRDIFSFFFDSNQLLAALFSGIIEMTGGCKAAAELDILPALIIISFCVSFGGISVICQTVSAAMRYKIKTQRLLASKLVQGLLSAAFTFIYALIVPPNISAFLQYEAAPAPGLMPLLTSAAISLTGLLLRKRA